jgi:hypothetical protein
MVPPGNLITSVLSFTEKKAPFSPELPVPELPIPELPESVTEATPVVLARAGKVLIANITAATVNSRTKRFNTLYLLTQGEVSHPTMSRNNINDGNK